MSSVVEQCECGCREPVKPGRRFIHGHHNRRPRPNRRKAIRWIEQDCGYLTPCWIWQLATTTNGYGQTGLPGTGGRAYLAHRVNYEALHGPIPDGQELDHLCRVPLCVNPEHVEPVTRALNVQRGRVAKLTPEQVAEIRAARGISQTALARRYNVGQSTISSILRGETWA